MTTTPVPENESQRLATLRALGLLDTPAEERFDRITRTVAYFFDVPIALISLIDLNRQWFKSCIGLPFSETERGISFCTHAILDDDIFVVPDAHADRRFADNPLVVNPPHIRFYAGCPLDGSDNTKMGTLCIMDHHPRQLTAAEQTRLRDLGKWVELELSVVQSLRQKIEATSAQQQALEVLLEDSEAHLQSVIDAAPMPMAVTRVDDGTLLFVNEALSALLGQTVEHLLGVTDKRLYVKEDDYRRVTHTLERQEALFDYEVLLRGRGQIPVQVRLSIQPILFDGEAAWLMGVQQAN